MKLLIIRHGEPDYTIDGLTEKGFDSSSIHVFNSLDEAVRELKSFVQPGDTVMYENDLPDSYSEGV